MALTIKEWDLLQQRGCDPLKETNSGIVNYITRIISRDEDVIISNFDIIANSNTSLLVKCGVLVKDNVVIKLINDVNIDMTDIDFYNYYVTAGLNSIGKYYVCLKYKYQRLVAVAPVAIITIVKNLNELTDDFMILKIVNVVESSPEMFEIESLMNIDPDNLHIRRNKIVRNFAPVPSFIYLPQVSESGDTCFVLDDGEGNSIWYVYINNEWKPATATISQELLTEQVQDIVGEMFEDNVENNINITYDEVTGKMNVESPAIYTQVNILDQTDIDNGYVTLQYFVQDENNLTARIQGYPGLFDIGSDYVILIDKFQWGGYNLENILKVGDRLTLTWQVYSGDIIGGGSGDVDREMIEDIVGEMFTNNIEVGTTVSYDDSIGKFTVNDADQHYEEFVLNSTDVSNKYVTLTFDCLYPNKTEFRASDSPGLFTYNDHFYIDSGLLKWDNSYLKDVFTIGTKLIVKYI